MPPSAPVSRSDFDELYRRSAQWDRWEDADRGAFNRVDPATVVSARDLIQSGRVVTTALPWNTIAEIDNPKPALHYMVDLRDNEAPEPGTNKDFIAIDYHGKAVSHLDALSHIAYEGQLFGGRSSADVVGTTGARFGSVSSLGPFVGRCVLLDMPRVFDVPWLEPGTALFREDLDRAETELGAQLSSASALLIRTGHKRRRNDIGAWDSSGLSAGLHVDAAAFLLDREIALLGSDGDSDARPSPVPGVHSPIHVLAITGMGIPLLDNLDLEALSEACAAENRWEFFFTVAPLNVPRGTGSPVNPIAVF